MQPNSAFPGSISRAIILLLVFIIAQLVAAAPFVLLNPSLAEHPLVAGILSLIISTAVLVYGVKKNAWSFSFFIGITTPDLRVWIAGTVTFIGMNISLAEIDNLFQSILPMPKFFVDSFEDLTKAEFGFISSLIPLVIIAPVTEELIFRGLLLRSFLTRYSEQKGIIATAVLFGIIHLNPWQFIDAFLGGLILGWCYVKTGSVLLPIYGHAIQNGLPFFSRQAGVELPGYNIYATGFIGLLPWWFYVLGLLLLVSGLLWLRGLFQNKMSPLVIEPSS